MGKAFLLLFCCTLFTGTAQAQEENSRQIAGKLERAIGRPDGHIPRQIPADELARQFVDLEVAALRRDAAAAKRIVTAFESMEISAEARELCRVFLTGVQKERSDRNAEFSRRVGAAIKKAQGACQSAKDEFDLNATLRELYALQLELKDEPSEPKIEGLITRLDWTSEAVSTYQDGLAFRDGGYDKQAEEERRKIASFVAGEENFTGPRHVVGILNADGSMDVTWENLPGNDEPIQVQDFDQQGKYHTIGVAPPGATSLHLPSEREKKAAAKLGAE